MSATIVDHLGMCEGRLVATPRLPQSSFARRLGIVLYVSADCSRCASRRCCSSSVPLNAQHQPFLNHTSGLIALVAANLFVVVIAMSWGPAVWVLLGEKFPNHIRAAALSVTACAQWVANWLITVTFPTLQQLGLGLANGLYAAFAVLSFVFVLRFVKESNGRELEDMTA